MTDRDIVARAAALLERAVTPERARKVHHKPPYITQIKGVGAVALMRAVRPVLFVAEDDRASSWLAGLLIQMCDAAVVFRAARNRGASAVSIREPERKEWRPTYVAKVGGKHAADWMRTLRSLMGEPRQSAIDTPSPNHVPSIWSIHQRHASFPVAASLTAGAVFVTSTT